MRTHVRLIAAVLVPLLALGPSCVAPVRQVRLQFEQDQGIVTPRPVPPVEISEWELRGALVALSQDRELIAFLRQPEDARLRLLPASYVLGDAFVPGYQQLCAARREALKRQCEAATAFEDLQDAGKRFGTIVGENAGRIIVMLVVAAMGANLGTFSARLSKLPGFGRAAQALQLRLGFSFGAIAAGQVTAVTVSSSGVAVALAPGALPLTTHAMIGSGDGTEPPKSAPVGFRNMDAFKKAMGSAGPDKHWHHIVEQNPGNLARFGSQRLHSTDNVVSLG